MTRFDQFNPNKKSHLYGGLINKEEEEEEEEEEEKILSWHRAIFARCCHLTIVAAAAFHNRVRDGSVWFHSAMNTRKSFLR